MQWLTVSAVFVVAAFVQAVTGVGYALLAAPILLMVAPSLVPVPLLLTGLVILTNVVIRDHDSIDLASIRGWFGGVRRVWTLMCLLAWGIGSVKVQVQPVRRRH